MINTIDSSLLFDNRPNQTKQTGDSALGKDDFLKILIAQLQNQDPSKPMDDREFVSQMAQFSSLEQMSSMNKTLETFIMTQTNSKMFEYSHLIGKEVRLLTGYDDKDLPIYEKAVVEAVGQRNDQVAVKLANGKWATEDQIVEIGKVKENTPPIDTTTPTDESVGNETEQPNEQEDVEETE